MAQADEQLWILGGLGLVALILAMIVRRLMLGRPPQLPNEGPLRLLIRPLKELRPDPNHLYLGTSISRELAVLLKKFERVEPSLGDALSSLSIEGTVRKTGPRLVMNIRLLSGRHPIWTGTYDGAMNDLAHMQSEIANHVARSLNIAPRKLPANPVPANVQG